MKKRKEKKKRDRLERRERERERDQKEREKNERRERELARQEHDRHPHKAATAAGYGGQPSGISPTTGLPIHPTTSYLLSPNGGLTYHNPPPSMALPPPLPPSLPSPPPPPPPLSSQPSNPSAFIDRSTLRNIRVVQRNLAYVLGLPPSLASEETLRKGEYFGQYGKIVKVRPSLHSFLCPFLSSSFPLSYPALLPSLSSSPPS